VPDAPDEDGHRCDHRPLDRLDATVRGEGLLIRRATDLMCASFAVHIGLDEIRADEFCNADHRGGADL
jgi:hypothetical protein